MALVSNLTVYPVKGARGINLNSAGICSTGFAYDRHWVVIRKSQFESQRKDPRMALIGTSLPDEAFTQDPSTDLNADLVLTVPGQEPLKVPLGEGRSMQQRTCSVWDWTGEAYDEGDVAAEYLSDFMGHEVRLVRYAGESSQGTPDSDPKRRALDPKYSSPNTETAFSDAMPFLLTNEASLEDLNSRCSDEEIYMNRFRPNIVVKQAEAWEEDTWQELKIGGLEFISSMPTGRCTVTTVNQTTGKPSPLKEPLKTLQTFRKGSQLGFTAERSWQGLVHFGWYLIAAQRGILRVGDPVEILKRRTGPPEPWGQTS